MKQKQKPVVASLTTGCSISPNRLYHLPLQDPAKNLCVPRSPSQLPATPVPAFSCLCCSTLIPKVVRAYGGGLSTLHRRAWVPAKSLVRCSSAAPPWFQHSCYTIVALAAAGCSKSSLSHLCRPLFPAFLFIGSSFRFRRCSVLLSRMQHSCSRSSTRCGLKIEEGKR